MSDSYWDREIAAHSNTDEDWVEESKPETVSTNIVSLLNLGELKAKFHVRGSEIVLRTLKMDEELEIGVLVDKYVRTIEEGRAIATAVVAASIESVNGLPIATSLGPDDNVLQKKFDYVRTKMYWPVIKMIYEEAYIPLVEQQLVALEEFRKK